VRPIPKRLGGKAGATVSALIASIVLSGLGGAAADENNGRPSYVKKAAYTSFKDWNLKAENIVPFGHNPLYFPLKAGHRHIQERPDHPDGRYRKETEVLNETEDFDVAGIGKFKTAVIMEHEYVDGVLSGRTRHWFAMDKATNSVFSFGEVSWEIDEHKRPHFSEAWRAGDPDGEGISQPGMLMPGTVAAGARYVFEGSNFKDLGVAEIVETGIKITVPAGTFEGCVKVHEQSLQNVSDVTERVLCPVVGAVLDSSDGKLVASSALPPDHPGSNVSSFGTFLSNTITYQPPVPKISSDQAVHIALKTIPGRATGMKIERKRGKYVWSVEIMTPDHGEKDVFVDIESGDVVGTD
jgi:hypothetical protein